MSRRVARVGGAALMAAGVALAAVGGAALLNDNGASPPSTGILARAAQATAASAPFPDLTETEVSVGEARLRIVVADDATERTQGLRARADLGDYDGMLFVFDAQSESAFTMSTVPVALDIGFFDAAGRSVDRLRMKPCAGTESECPIYRSSGPFRFALETLAGDLPPGRLSG